MYKTLWRRRSLLWAMVRRQYQLRYRQSLGGFAWAIIPPIASLVVATIVFHHVIGVNTGKVPYALFTLAGLTAWTFLSSGLSMGVILRDFCQTRSPLLVRSVPTPVEPLRW